MSELEVFVVRSKDVTRFATLSDDACNAAKVMCSAGQRAVMPRGVQLKAVWDGSGRREKTPRTKDKGGK